LELIEVWKLDKAEMGIRKEEGGMKEPHKLEDVVETLFTRLEKS